MSNCAALTYSAVLMTAIIIIGARAWHGAGQ
jgi:hypothetical protein